MRNQVPFAKIVLFLYHLLLPPKSKVETYFDGPSRPERNKVPFTRTSLHEQKQVSTLGVGEGGGDTKKTVLRTVLYFANTGMKKRVGSHTFFAPSQFSLELFGRARDLLMLPCHYFETQITAHAGPSSQTAGRRGGASQRGRLTDRKSRPQA